VIVAELEEAAVGPDVGGVVGDVDRNVADQRDPAAGGGATQGLPLLLEDGLLDDAALDGPAVLGARGGERRRIVVAQRR